MTSSEVADYLGLSTSRVRQLALAGKLPAVRHGRDWIFQRSDVVKFAEVDRPTGRPKSE